jgi:hypothetical protein
MIVEHTFKLPTGEDAEFNVCKGLDRMVRLLSIRAADKVRGVEVASFSMPLRRLAQITLSSPAQMIVDPRG